MSLAFVRAIHRWPVNSRHKWPVTRKMFPFDDAIMIILSLSMLNCIKDYKRYVHFLNRVWDFAWSKSTKSTLEQQCMLSVLHSQYHAFWCSGDFRSQNITRHGIDHPKSEYSVSSIKWVKSTVVTTITWQSSRIHAPTHIYTHLLLPKQNVLKRHKLKLQQFLYNNVNTERYHFRIPNLG